MRGDTLAGNVSDLLLVGLAMLIFAWIVRRASEIYAAMDANSLSTKVSRRLDSLIQIVRGRPLLYSGIFFGGCAVLVAPYSAFQPWPVLALWVIGIALYLVGVATLVQSSTTKGTIADLSLWVRDVKRELLAIVALTILGLLLRSIGLDTIPHNVHGDEGEMGIAARAVLSGELRDPFSTAWHSHSTLWFFIQALGLRLFGNNIGGLRMLSALLGTLTVSVLYIYARPLYGRAVAIIATALLASYHFHVHFSRIGLNNIADPLMMLSTLAALFYGYNRHAPLGFALAGIIMGLAQYFYFSALFIPMLVLALLAFLIVRDRRLLEFRGQIGLMATGLILALGPLLRYYIAHPETFFGRMTGHNLLQNGHLANIQVNGQSLLAALAHHAYRAIGLFVAVDEHSPFYDAGIPLLDHGMEVLFILGVVLVLLKWRKIEMIALLLWIVGVAVFGGFLLWDSPQSQRYILAAPALCILVGLALVQIGSLIRQILVLPLRLYLGTTTIIVLALMSWNIYFYFSLYTPQNTYAQAQAVTEIARFLRPQPGRYYIYMFTPPQFYLNHGTIRFLANDPEGIDIIDTIPSPTTLAPLPTGLRPLFVFIPERLGELQIIKQQYPNGQLREYLIQPSGDREIMYIYEPQ